MEVAVPADLLAEGVQHELGQGRICPQLQADILQEPGLHHEAHHDVVLPQGRAGKDGVLVRDEDVPLPEDDLLPGHGDAALPADHVADLDEMGPVGRPRRIAGDAAHGHRVLHRLIDLGPSGVPQGVLLEAPARLRAGAQRRLKFCLCFQDR